MGALVYPLEGEAGTPVHTLAPEERLALEMAVTEEVERVALRARAHAAEPVWRAEEEIGAIADELLVPAPVVRRLAALRTQRNGSGPAAGAP